MVEILATFGLASKELFDYNRENFQFDAEQRIERELLRLEMQVSRFELFREDIRDLVELTVGKMEMYHLVGALMLEKSVALYCEGRIKMEDSPFLLGAYYISVAGAFACLLLAVYLSMYASICSHSFGVRLLTRYVRLPIPGEEQLSTLNAKLRDYETQGKQVLRVPFVGGGDWERRAETAPSEAGSSSAGPAPQIQKQEDMLGKGELPLGQVAHIMKASANMPGKHVQLYRRLQSKWQCYDAYTRVCMAIGANQILLAFTFYLINVTLIEYAAPSACYACIMALQMTALALTYIDIAKLGHFTVIGVQSLPLAACFIAAIEANVADKHGRKPAPDTKYYVLPLTFFLVSLWFECMVHIAKPAKDESSLPRRFRAVLFLDVFEDADLEGSEDQHPTPWTESARKAHLKPLLTAKMARQADDALFNAHCALRRWEAVPAGLSDAQKSEVKSLRSQLNIWREALNAEAAERARRRGMQDACLLLELDERPWYDLSEQEQAEDPEANSLCGPFKSARNPEYYYSLERNQFVYEADSNVLSLPDLAAKIGSAEAQVRSLLDGEGHGESSDEGMSGSDEDSDDWNVRPNQGPQSFVGSWRGRQAKSSSYAAPRRPWVVLRMFLRALQFAWFMMGAAAAIQAYSDVQWDFQNFISSEEPGEKHEKVEPRELAAAPLAFAALAAEHPQGELFAAERLSCLPADGRDDGELLFVSSGRETYRASMPGATSPPGLRFALGGLPANATALCGEPEAAAGGEARQDCLLASLDDGGAALALWPPGAPAAAAWRLPILAEGPWQKFDGAIVPCGDVEALLEGPSAGRCLLLAGWGGGRVAVAAAPLGSGSGFADLGSLAGIFPAFDLPAAEAAAPAGRAAPGALGVLDLHVHGASGSAWLLTGGGELQAWDLRRPRSLGRWRPRWPDREFRAKAMCATAGGRAVVVGEAAGGRAGWCEAPLPRAWLGAAAGASA